MKSPAPETLCAKGVFQIQPHISGVDFLNNVLVPHITRHNLQNLLTF